MSEELILLSCGGRQCNGWHSTGWGATPTLGPHQAPTHREGVFSGHLPRPLGAAGSKSLTVISTAAATWDKQAPRKSNQQQAHVALPSCPAFPRCLLRREQGHRATGRALESGGRARRAGRKGDQRYFPSQPKSRQVQSLRPTRLPTVAPPHPRLPLPSEGLCPHWDEAGATALSERATAPRFAHPSLLGTLPCSNTTRSPGTL